MAACQLAQVNVARMIAPLDDLRMADFVAALDPVNALAERSPGFIWRLKDEDGDATSIRVFDDDMLLVNMSVWESADALREFVYAGRHGEVMRQRRRWFAKNFEAYLALWWVPAGKPPSVADAEQRLEALRRDGPSEFAFTFGRLFPPPQ